MSDMTTKGMIGVQRKMILGEALILPPDAIAECQILLESLGAEHGDTHLSFCVGFTLKLSHANFVRGYRTFSSALAKVATFELAGHQTKYTGVGFGSDSPKWGARGVVRTRQAVEAVSKTFQAFIIDQYLAGEVDSHLLRATFATRYGQEVRKRARRRKPATT